MKVSEAPYVRPPAIVMAASTLPPLSPEPDLRFSQPASAERVERTIAALRAHNIETLLLPDGAAARAEVERRVTANAEVFTATSRTLERYGIMDLLDKSGRYRSARAAMTGLNPATQARDRARLSATPEFVVGSVHAVTETGEVLVASASGSQLAPYSSGAAKVIWVVGTQKIVATMDEAWDRLRRYAYPLEDRRAREAYGFPSVLSKVLVFLREPRPGRITLIFVPEAVGF